MKIKCSVLYVGIWLSFSDRIEQVSVIINMAERPLWLLLLLLLSCCSRVRLFTTPWTAAHQAPPSMGFSRQEYWSGLPLPSLTVASTVYQNVCKYIYQDPNPKVQHLPFTVNQWWKGNCLRIYKTETCSIMHRLQELLRGSSVPTSLRSTTTHSGGGSQPRDGEKGADGDAYASIRTNPSPTWDPQRHFQSPQGQDQGQACGWARGQASALFPSMLSSQQGDLDFHPHSPSPFLLPVMGSFSLCLSPTHSFLTPAPVSTQTAWESTALLWKDYFPTVPGLQKTIISVTILRSFDYVPDTFPSTLHTLTYWMLTIDLWMSTVITSISSWGNK